MYLCMNVNMHINRMNTIVAHLKETMIKQVDNKWTANSKKPTWAIVLTAKKNRKCTLKP